MSKEKDTIVVQLGDIGPVLKNGVSSRAFTALLLTGKPYMTVEEMAEICGFSPKSLVNGGCISDLFHAQLVEPVRDKNYKYKTKVKGYRLTEKARKSIRTMDDELEELAERAERSLRVKKKKRPLHSGMAVIDGGSSESKSSE